MKELTLERYLLEEGLREDLQRAAHRERAHKVHRLLAVSIETLLSRSAPHAVKWRTAPRGSHVQGRAAPG